jgi:peptide chain release factor 2
MSGGGFDSSNLQHKIAELEKQTLEPGFWEDKKGAETLFSELNGLKDS